MSLMCWLIISWIMRSTSFVAESKRLSSKNYCSQSPYDRTHRGKNDSIFERLDVTFTFEQAEQQSVAVKGATATHETVRQMLKNWKRQGLISILPDKRYQKVTSII